MDLDWLHPGLQRVFFEGVRIAASAATSALVTIFVVNRIKTRSDHADKRIDDIVADIKAVADLASGLWMQDAGSETLALLETKITTRIRQIEDVRVLASATAPELRLDAVEQAASQFSRALTGGDFGVHNRQASLDVARSCHHAANRYISVLRRTRARALR